ncbi:uncharacterized protein DNG_08417 [Cephalotrichum gorgonifer]|uniref:Uncharacterized protein n=1 Tax=Cephalotrichum gorgonifer TaxID=2041049 RepID=A0AAE8SYC0_9PEZI|nr:uncharacterized protein DNG_08417 [Cephalotrichum gorgonifer]
MAPALRQLSAGARFTARRKVYPRAPVALAPARSTQSSSKAPGYHTIAPLGTQQTRNDALSTVKRRVAGSRQYWVLAGDEVPPEDSKKKKADEERLNLGKTISTLKDRLPTILQQPLPPEILAPNISLHLFPTTHPHLPVANGKAAYKAALWTSPLAWNRLPIIGSVGIEVQSVRLQQGPLPFVPARIGSLDEVLVVRWVTEPSSLPSEFLRNMAARISPGGEEEDMPTEFHGLFAFQFDGKGRVLDHTIESAEHSRHWSKGVGSRVVSFTDRVLGGIRQRGTPDPLPMPAACWRRDRGKE